MQAASMRALEVASMRAASIGHSRWQACRPRASGTRGGEHAGRPEVHTAKTLLTGLARNMSRRVVEMQGTIGELSHFDVHKRDVEKRESLSDSRFA